MKDPFDERSITDPGTGERIPPKAQPGYYPGFHVLSQQNYWDAATRAVVLARLADPPPRRFFNAAEAVLLTTVCDHILPQDDRDLAHRIPIVPAIDRRLFSGRTAGYRFAEMPPDAEAYRLGLRAFDQMAIEIFRCSFLEISWQLQDELLKSVHDGEPRGAASIWRDLPCRRFWTLLMQDCLETYYAHPWSWDEIGFGGPAYPRGYVRLERGEPEPWEVTEKRYQWAAPNCAVSDQDDLSITALHRSKGEVNH